MFFTSLPQSLHLGWCHPALAAPADAFSQDGQLWGNPTYTWQAHKDEGYRWWIERFRRPFYLSEIIEK